MTIGQRIQELRETAGLTQEALSRQLQVSRRTVAKWESGDAIPNLNHLVSISRVFDISIGSLLQIADIKAPKIPEGMTEQEWILLEQMKKTKPRPDRMRSLFAALLIIFAVLIGLMIWFLTR